MRYKALLAITLLSVICLLVFPVPVSAAGHGHAFGGNRGGAFYSYPYWGGGWGGGWGWGLWGYPYWGYYGPENYSGKIKIEDVNKNDQVYLNGAYAGTVKKLKNIWLDPGRYSIEVREQGKDLVNQYVYVMPGKTVDISVNKK